MDPLVVVALGCLLAVFCCSLSGRKDLVARQGAKDGVDPGRRERGDVIRLAYLLVVNKKQCHMACGCLWLPCNKFAAEASRGVFVGDGEQHW